MEAVKIALRPACPQDFDHCERLYFSEMKIIIQELNLDMRAQIVSFRQQWDSTQVRIITLAGVDVGWLQSVNRSDALFLAQLFVESRFQRQGIGTAVMNFAIAEAACARQAVTLGVAKISPALRLYRRLGFRITHEDDRKFYMRRDIDADAPISKNSTAR